MESTDQDIVEIRVDEEMNDLDEDNSDLVQNGNNEELKHATTMDTDEHRNSSKKVQVTEESDDLELDSEPETDYTETNEDAEENEKELMNMPSLQSVMSDMSQLKQRRRVMVHPIKVQELGHPKVLEIISKVTCEEIKLHFVRPQNKPEEWHGILLMHFGSTKAAQQATENLKSVRGDLNIRCKEATAYASRTMDQWVKEEKGQKRWTDTLLWAKNIPDDTQESQLYEAFPDAEDIVMHRRVGKMNGPKETKGAFVVYQNGDSAQKAAKVYEANSPEVNGRTLKVLKYHIPQEMIPRGLLKLRERLLVLKYLEKLEAVKSKYGSDESKVPDWCIQRLEKCKSLIEKDCRVRKAAGLPMPSLEELRALKGVKVIRGIECKETLQRLGILPVSAQQRRLISPKNRGNSYNGADDERNPKIQSLFEVENQMVGKHGSRTSRYPSLLGDPPPPYLMSGQPMSSQWATSANTSRNQVTATNHGFSNLGSVNASVAQRAAVNPSANQMTFLSQANAFSFMNPLKPQTSANFIRGKTPLLASPGTVEMANPFLTAATRKVPLLGRDFVEPPQKILRLDASGSFHFADHKQGSNASSRLSKLTSLLDL